MRSKLSGKPSTNSWPSPSALLDNAPDVWRRMDLPRQQRLQSAFFPEGLAFDGDNFGTAEINPVFRALQDLEAGDGSLVAHTVPSWNRIQAWRLDLSQLQQDLPSSLAHA